MVNNYYINLKCILHTFYDQQNIILQIYLNNSELFNIPKYVFTNLSPSTLSLHHHLSFIFCFWVNAHHYNLFTKSF